MSWLLIMFLIAPLQRVFSIFPEMSSTKTSLHSLQIARKQKLVENMYEVRLFDSLGTYFPYTVTYSHGHGISYSYSRK